MEVVVEVKEEVAEVDVVVEVVEVAVVAMGMTIGAQQREQFRTRIYTLVVIPMQSGLP